MENGYQNKYYWPNWWIDNYWVEWGTSTGSAVSTTFYPTIGMIKNTYNTDIVIYYVTESISTITKEIIHTESTGETMRARVRPLTQFEIMKNNKRGLETSHRVYCDWSTLFNAKDKMVYDGNTYEIVGILDPSHTHQFMEMDIKYVN
jgi:SPP1 family predicted phage head-tail adaptor